MSFPPQDMLGRPPLLLILTGLLSLGCGEFYEVSSYEVCWEEQTHPVGITPLTEPNGASSPDLTSPVPLSSPPLLTLEKLGWAELTHPNFLPSPDSVVYQGQSEHLSGLHQLRAWLRLVPEAGKKPMG